MHQTYSRIILTSAVLICFIGTVPAIAATPCESLASVSLPHTKIMSAQVVGAGTFVPPGAAGEGAGRGGAAANAFASLPAFCRVTATLTPTSDSDIRTEVWLPASGWNGKFLAVGNGGWAGTIPYAALADAVKAGYAGAGTDTGHVGNSAEFALGHPEKLIDIAYRSIHEMTVESKALINAHYGIPVKFSYYNGCSQGGRQGLAAAQTYPEDFDGIVAGAATWDQMRAHGARTALNLLVNKDADTVIPPSKYRMIHDAVLNACDALDGVKDGVLENPMQCKFDYAQLLCKDSDSSTCLTKGQVQSAKLMTSPLKDPKTGRVLFEPHLMPGAELGWATNGGPQPLGPALTAMRSIVFKDKNWDYHTMDISTDVDHADKSDDRVMYSGDPNLKAFFDHGGKLLMYHGWTDPQVSPMLSVTYYNNVLKAVGKDKAANSIALFMMPGMNHCRGGDGPDTFGQVKAIEQWVEQGKKPTQILASHLRNGQVDKTRPICAYPQVAKYNGSGDVNDAANFSCASALENR
jgi:feruloyl esterase